MLDFDVAKGDYSKLQGMNPFKSIAVPRPIGWISTVSKNGVDNLAPYSQFCNVGFDPPYVSCAAKNRPVKKGFCCQCGGHGLFRPQHGHL